MHSRGDSPRRGIAGKRVDPRAIGLRDGVHLFKTLPLASLRMKASATLQRRSNALGQAITASTVGNVLEWFDFAVYGSMAPYIGPLFFPSHDPVASTIAALRNHWRELVEAIGVVTGANVVLRLMFVFVIHIAVEAGGSHIEEMNTIGLAVTIPATVLGGRLSTWRVG